MKELIASLEQLEKSIRTGQDTDAARKTLEQVLTQAAAWKGADAPQLKEELSVWKTKWSVILKEPVGRQGMAKHVRHWIEKING